MDDAFGETFFDEEAISIMQLRVFNKLKLIEKNITIKRNYIKGDGIKFTWQHFWDSNLTKESNICKCHRLLVRLG